jgi:hypothetical protein
LKAIICRSAFFAVFYIVSGCCETPASNSHPSVDASSEIQVLASGPPQELGDRAIASLVAKGPEVIPQIADAIARLPADADGSYLGEALFAFGPQASPANDAVYGRLILGSWAAYVWATVLAETGEEGQQLLIRGLDPAHPELCLIAALSKLEPNTDAAVIALAHLADHPSSEVRSATFLAMQGVSPPSARPLLPALRLAVEHDDTEVRSSALSAAEWIGTRGDAVTADAIARRVLQDCDEIEMRHSIKVLILLGASTPTVRRALDLAAGGEDEITKELALDALQKLFP